RRDDRRLQAGGWKDPGGLPAGGGRRLQRDDAAARAEREAIGAYFERLESHEGNDAALDDMLEPGNPWNGQIRAIGTY
ncbi:hypothetical protein ACC709_37235, partial [Rhizobium ruizarguesonis]